MKIGEDDFIKNLIAANIKRLREDRGWSQEELADRAKTYFQYISSIERGVRGCGPLMRKKIAKAFGLPESELIKMPPGMAPKELEEMWNRLCKLYDAGMQGPLIKIIKAIERCASGEISPDIVNLLETQADMICRMGKDREE